MENEASGSFATKGLHNNHLRRYVNLTRRHSPAERLFRRQVVIGLSPIILIEEVLQRELAV